jgi:cob(I)alamin adenosyltransferase
VNETGIYAGTGNVAGSHGNAADNGLIHIYTGTGKGKTTAALGLCFRAAGWGFESAFIQFMKGQETGELIAAKKFTAAILFEQYGSEKFITKKNLSDLSEDKIFADKGIVRAKELLLSNRYRIVVLDEILNLLEFELITEDEILELMEIKGKSELILTGRGATDQLIKRADLVTEMKEIKHYYSSGVIARKGVEY